MMRKTKLQLRFPERTPITEDDRLLSLLFGTSSAEKNLVVPCFLALLISHKETLKSFKMTRHLRWPFNCDNLTRVFLSHSGLLSWQGNFPIKATAIEFDQGRLVSTFSWHFILVYCIVKFETGSGALCLEVCKPILATGWPWNRKSFITSQPPLALYVITENYLCYACGNNVIIFIWRSIYCWVFIWSCPKIFCHRTNYQLQEKRSESFKLKVKVNCS